MLGASHSPVLYAEGESPDFPVAAPTIVSVLVDSSFSFIILFTPPAGATQYDVSTDGGATWQSNIAVSATLGANQTIRVTGTSASGGITALTANTTYVLLLRARVGIEIGDTTARTSVVTLTSDPATVAAATGSLCKCQVWISACRLMGGLLKVDSSVAYQAADAVNSVYDYISGVTYSLASGGTAAVLGNDGSGHWYLNNTTGSGNKLYVNTSLSWNSIGWTAGFMANLISSSSDQMGFGLNTALTSGAGSSSNGTIAAGFVDGTAFKNASSTIVAGVNNWTIVSTGVNDQPRLITQADGTYQNPSTITGVRGVNEIALMWSGKASPINSVLTGGFWYGGAVFNTSVVGSNATSLGSWLANMVTF